MAESPRHLARPYYDEGEQDRYLDAVIGPMIARDDTVYREQRPARHRAAPASADPETEAK